MVALLNLTVLGFSFDGDDGVGLGWKKGGGGGWQSRKLRRDRRPRLARMGQKWSTAQITIMVDGKNCIKMFKSKKGKVLPSLAEN